MTQKITVEVCLGTTCYVLGGGEILELERLLPPELKDRVKIVGAPCLDACTGRNYDKAPFVRINGSEIISDATPERVIATIWAAVGDSMGDAT